VESNLNASVAELETAFNRTSEARGKLQISIVAALEQAATLDKAMAGYRRAVDILTAEAAAEAI
jgi:exonuclease VII small subunit